MKKIIMFFAAAIMMAFLACSGCSEDKDKPATVAETNDFDELYLSINKIIAEKYPAYALYEVEANFSDDDSLANQGVINPMSMKVVYGFTEGNKTLMATVDSAFNVNIEIINSPWLEDMYMTPYQPMTLKYAVEILQNELGVHIKAGLPVCFRHQLWFKEPEPRYFLGTAISCHTVNVYTAEVDQPLAEPTEEFLKEHGLDSEAVGKLGKLMAKPVE